MFEEKPCISFGISKLFYGQDFLYVKNMAEKMIIEGKKGIMNDFNWENEENKLYSAYDNI